MLADLIAKHGRVRTIRMPTWVKVAIDAWTAGGRKQLVRETSQWCRLAYAIGRVVGPEAVKGSKCFSDGLAPTFPKICARTWNWKPTGCASRDSVTNAFAFEVLK